MLTESGSIADRGTVWQGGRCIRRGESTSDAPHPAYRRAARPPGMTATSCAALQEARRPALRRRRRQRARDDGRGQVARDEAEPAIALELLLVEPLVTGALVREVAVKPLVRADIDWIGVGDCGLQNDQLAVLVRADTVGP